MQLPPPPLRGLTQLRASLGTPSALRARPSINRGTVGECFLVCSYAHHFLFSIHSYLFTTHSSLLTLSTYLVCGLVRPALHEVPEAFTLEMGGGAYLAEAMIEGGALAYLGLHEAVEDERDEEAHQHHDIELNVHRSAEAVGYVPAEHHEEVGTDDGERGADMREAQLDVEVVEVGLVGVERGLALEQAGTHHAKRVEDGDAQHGEREGDKTEAAIDRKGCRRRGEQRDDEYGEDDAQRERAGIADEHLGLLAEHVVEEEREQRGGNDCGKNDHLEIAQMIEDKAEQSAADDAVARGVAVDTVDEVDGIDDAYAGEDRQGNGDRGGDGIKAPEAVEVIELVARGADEVEHQQYLDNEPHLGRQRDDVVHEAHDEDDEDAGEDGEQVEVAAKQAVAHDAREHTEDDGKSAHDGNGNTLQLAGIGVVDDVLALGYLEHIRVDPACAVERDERRDQDLKEFVHDCLLFVSHGEDKFRIMGDQLSTCSLCHLLYEPSSMGRPRSWRYSMPLLDITWVRQMAFTRLWCMQCMATGKGLSLTWSITVSADLRLRSSSW